MQLAALVAAGTMIISGCGISAGADSATTQAAAQTEQAATSETAESTDETAAADDGALVIKEQGIFSAGGSEKANRRLWKEPAPLPAHSRIEWDMLRYLY